MRVIRQWLRQLLLRIFGRWGEAYILPMVRLIYRKLPFYDYRRMQYAANEARQIRSAISSRNVDRFSIVLDYRAIGWNYGDCIYVLGVARYLMAHQCYVNIYFANTEFVDENMGPIPDTQSMSSSFVDEMIRISRALLDPCQSSITTISQEQLSALTAKRDDEYLLFSDYVRTSRFFAGDCFNVFNHLLAPLSEGAQDEILYSVDEFNDFLPRSIPRDSYISWACRYPLNSVDMRHVTRGAFSKIYSYLKLRYPYHKIMIISDHRGCKHYLSISESLGIDDLLFSKDYSPDFLGDTALVMNSAFLFWYRAGSIDVIPRYSRLPYEMLGHLGHEVMWDKERICSWQGHDQAFFNIGILRPGDDRSTDLQSLNPSC